MFVRETQQKPKEMYYADSLMTQPTSTQSAYENLAGGLASSLAVVGDIQNLFYDKPQGNMLRDVAESVQIMNQTPSIGWKQGLANELSNMVGYGLNPIVWGFGRLGGIAAEATIGAATRLSPEAINVFMRRPLTEVLGEPLSKYVPKVAVAGEKVPLTSAMIGEKYVEAFGTFAGAGVPAAWYENYNADTRHIDWGGGASDLGKMGAFGLAIQSIPFAWGILKSRVSRAIDKPAAELIMADYDSALKNGLITHDEHTWIKDYLENPLESPDLKARATKILAANDVNANMATHETPVEFVSADQMQNLNSALLDQSLADLSPDLRTSLSDFIIHNGVDGIREKPQLLDGLRGFRDHVDEKLKYKAEKIAEADKMLDRHLTKSVNENMPFSQKEMFKTMQKVGFESSHIKAMPLTIPENLQQALRRMEEIERIELKNKEYEKKIKQGRKNLQGKLSGNLKRIEQLKEKIPKVLTPKEELQYLRSKLLSEKGLPKGWERSTAYHRLVDLSHVWENARTLLDRVHHEASYEIQESYRNLSDHILQMADSNIGRFANRDNVVNYMRDRIKGKAFRQEPDIAIAIKVAEQSEVPANAKEILELNQVEIEKVGGADLTREFQQVAAKFKEFKNSESVFKSLVQCVLGGVNG